jgi:hypothetical protein
MQMKKSLSIIFSINIMIILKSFSIVFSIIVLSIVLFMSIYDNSMPMRFKLIIWVIVFIIIS